MDFRNMSDEAKMYIKAIIECIDDGIWITDGSGTCLEINRQALGCQKREDIIGKTMKELVGTARGDGDPHYGDPLYRRR